MNSAPSTMKHRPDSAAPARAASSFRQAFFSLALLVLAFAAAIPASASCGYSWEHEPSKPFMESSDCRFQYVEKFAQAEVSGQGADQSAIPLTLLFSPTSRAYPGGVLLGEGWWFPVFESTLLQTNARTFEMGLPNGIRATLDKKGNRLHGDGWRGTIGASETVLKTSCGWSAKFKNARLVEMTSPDREHYQFTVDRDGKRTLSYNGRVVLTLTQRRDPLTNFPIYLVNYTAQGKSQKAVLRMGMRPKLVKVSEKVNGVSVSKERETNTGSLRSLKIGDQPEQKYDFGTDTLAIEGVDKFFWRQTNGELFKTKDFQYSKTKIAGIDCRIITKNDGTTSIKGSSDTGEIEIFKSNNSSDIYKKECLPRSDKTKRLSIIKNGEEIELVRYFYDDNYRIFREINEGIRYDYAYNPNNSYSLVRAKDEKSGQLKWEKQFDTNGFIQKFVTETNTYHFKKLLKSSKTEVMQLASDGTPISTSLLNNSDVEKLFTP